jgi:hypothetical protein
MKNSLKLGFVAALALLLGNQAWGQAMNDPPPAGPVVLNLDGTPIPHQYQLYTTPEWIATSTTTNMSFAMREDPAFLSLDDVSVQNVTTGTPVTVVNGGFEQGPVGASAPTGWTYLNTFGAEAGGTVENEPGGAHSGSNYYFDGAVQAYDAITQGISTTIGDTYTISFWLSDNGPYNTFSALSTNGNTTGTGGNGVNLVVYAGVGVPTAVPEPASLVMLGTGLAFVGIVYRRRRKVA